MPRVSEEEQREVREVRQKVANGDVYVYEVTYERDPETNRRVQVSKRTLGKIPAGSTELIPTRGRTTAKAAVRTEPKAATKAAVKSAPKSAPKPAPRAAVRIASKPVPKAAPAIPADSPDHPFARVGLRKVLEWIGKASKIDRDLDESFEGDVTVALYGMARYWLATGGAPLTRIGAWERMCGRGSIFPEDPEPSEEAVHAANEDFFGRRPLDVCGEVFRCVTEWPGHAAEFFELRAQRARRLNPKRAWAFDVTVFDDEIDHPLRMREAFRRPLGADRVRMRKLLLLSVGEGLRPVAFAEPSVYFRTGSEICASLGGLKAQSPCEPVVVSGPELSNITTSKTATEIKLEDLAVEGTPFVLTMDDSVLQEPWLRKAVIEQEKALESYDIRGQSGGDVGIATIRREFTFEVRKPDSDERETVKRELIVHICKDWRAWRMENDRLVDTLWDLKKAVEAGQRHFTPGALELIQRHFEIRPKKAGEVANSGKPIPGDWVAEFIDGAQYEAEATMSVFVIVSNAIEDPLEALWAHRTRETVEEHFALCRDGFERRWSDVLTGRRFAQFLALCYKTFFERAVEKARQNAGHGAGAPMETDAAELLRKWLKGSGIVRFLDEFARVDARLTRGMTDDRMPWIRARDVRFLELIGYKELPDF